MTRISREEVVVLTLLIPLERRRRTKIIGDGGHEKAIVIDWRSLAATGGRVSFIGAASLV